MRSGPLHGALILSLVIFLLPETASGETGWYLMTDGEDSGLRYVRETLIANGKIKQLPRHAEDTWIVHDVDRGEITFVDPLSEVYVRATPAALCSALAEKTDEARDIVRQWVSDRPLSAAAGEQAPSEPLSVTVRDRRRSKTRLQDFVEALYEVRVDNRRYQTISLTTDERLLGALGGLEGLATYVDMGRELAGCARELFGSAGSVIGGARGVYVESAPEYLELMRKGWPLAKVWSLDGREVTETVTIASEWSVRPSDLEPPAGYRRVSLAEFLGLEAP